VLTAHVLKHIFTDFGSFPCSVVFYGKSKGRRWMLICGCIWQNKVTR